MDELVHGPHRFFHGRFLVWPVAKKQVEVVDAQALEGVVAGLGDVLSVQSPLGGQLAAGAKKDLGGDAPGVAGPIPLGEQPAHDLF